MKIIKNEQTKAMRILSLSAITGVFVIVAVLVFGAFKIIPLNLGIVTILGFIGIVCIACVMAIPWVERLGQKDINKTVCYVFLIIIGICMLLWLVCWLLTMNAIINKVENNKTLLNLIRISLIITIQFLVASTILYVMLKYKKTMILFQVVTYLSNLYIDFYATYIIVCLDIASGNIKFPGAEIIFSKVCLALLIISFLYVFISNAVLKSHQKRRANRVNENLEDTSYNEQQDNSTESKLKRLKNMLDDGLISDSEYNEKKSEIMKDF